MLDDDFSTLQTMYCYGEASPAQRAEYDAAVNRIRTALVDHQRLLAESQADVAMLRIDVQTFGRIHDSAEAEIARLSKSLSWALDDRDSARAEVERQKTRGDAAFRGQVEMREASKVEVERERVENRALRMSLDKDSRWWADRAKRAEAEVEQWKTRFEQEKAAFAAEHAELERLRADALDLNERLVARDNEVERLTAVIHDHYEPRLFTALTEVEGLRVVLGPLVGLDTRLGQGITHEVCPYCDRVDNQHEDDCPIVAGRAALAKEEA